MKRFGNLRRSIWIVAVLFILLQLLTNEWWKFVGLFFFSSRRCFISPFFYYCCYCCFLFLWWCWWSFIFALVLHAHIHCLNFIVFCFSCFCLVLHSLRYVYIILVDCFLRIFKFVVNSLTHTHTHTTHEREKKSVVYLSLWKYVYILDNSLYIRKCKVAKFVYFLVIIICVVRLCCCYLLMLHNTTLDEITFIAHTCVGYIVLQKKNKSPD